MLPERSLSWSRGSSTFPPRQVSFGTLERPRWRLWRPAAARRLCRTARALVRRPRHGLRPYFPENPAKPQNMGLTLPKVPQHTRLRCNGRETTFPIALDRMNDARAGHLLRRPVRISSAGIDCIRCPLMRSGRYTSIKSAGAGQNR